MTDTKEKFLRVTDSSCTAENPERRHHINVRGELKEIVFKLGEEVILPFEHAIKFMIDGFKVEQTDGKPVDLPAVASESVQATLAADEVIAKLSELTLASLKIRAGQKPGGEVYLDADDSARDDIIAFLLGKPPAGAEEPKTETVGEDESDITEGDGADVGNAAPAPDSSVAAAASPGPADAGNGSSSSPPVAENGADTAGATAAEQGSADAGQSLQPKPADAAPAPDAPSPVLATSGAQELAATVLDPDNTFANLKPATEGAVITESDVLAHIAANGLQPAVAPQTETADDAQK